ncbi:hypothetical protein [Paenibacillus sp. FSL L8-0709]|uniref:hypothetical protein n=1 Tax=Paenibacillus sp. FSL L8-0709 TaxID=2975312 RepID=UPI0030FA3D23
MDSRFKNDIFINKIDPNQRLDFSFLMNIKPNNNDLRVRVSEMDFVSEIEQLTSDINSMDIRGIPFDKWDYIVAFTIGLLEVAGDFLISDHNQNGSLANKLSDKNSALGEYFQSIHQKIDHSGQPIDFQGRVKLEDWMNSISFGGGDHRGRTMGHDLLLFPLSIYMLYSGKFIDGGYVDGSFKWIISQVNQKGNAYATLEPGEAVISYFLHMIADFFSAKSLPIPGFSLLTHFPQSDVRKFSQDLYKDGLNIRNLLLQGIPVATTELIIWIYNSLRYKDSTYSKEAIKNKKEKLLLISHGIATAVNIGKVIITKNPTSLNLIMIIRTVQLVWKVIKYEGDIKNKAKEKINLSIIKNQLEVMQTLILLDDALYYTSQIDEFIKKSKDQFQQNYDYRRERLKDSFNDMESMLAQLKEFNKQ